MIKIESFIKRIEEEFEDVKPGVLNAGSDFKKELEWNSVNALIMITLINSEFDIIINANDLNKAKTINDLFALVEDKINI
jgi:acyl carrier protein